MTDGKKQAPEDKVDVHLHQPPEKMSTPVLSLLLSTTTHAGVVAQSLKIPLPVHVELTVGVPADAIHNVVAPRPGGATVSASANPAAAPGGSRMSFKFNKDFHDAFHDTKDEMMALMAECHQILTDADIERKIGKDDSLPARIQELVEKLDRLESSAEDSWEHMAGEDA